MLCFILASSGQWACYCCDHATFSALRIHQRHTEIPQTTCWGDLGHMWPQSFRSVSVVLLQWYMEPYHNANKCFYIINEGSCTRTLPLVPRRNGRAKVGRSWAEWVTAFWLVFFTENFNKISTWKSTEYNHCYCLGWRFQWEFLKLWETWRRTRTITRLKNTETKKKPSRL